MKGIGLSMSANLGAVEATKFAMQKFRELAVESSLMSILAVTTIIYEFIIIPYANA